MLTGDDKKVVTIIGLVVFAAYVFYFLVSLSGFTVLGALAFAGVLTLATIVGSGLGFLIALGILRFLGWD